MRLVFLYSLSFVLLASGLRAQPPSDNTYNCYGDQRKRGIAFLEQGRYNEAINSLFTAYRCADRPKNDHDIDQQMDKVINRLRGVAAQAQQDAQATEVARADEAKARALAQQAQSDAEANAIEAERSAKEAESLRLVLLSDIEREKKNYRTALPLAYLALQLSLVKNRREALNNFGKVVRDSFVRKIPFDTELYQIDAHDGYVFFRDEQGISIWEETNCQLVQHFPKSTQYIPISGRSEILLLDKGTGAPRLFSATSKRITILDDNHSERITYASANDFGYLTSSRDNTTMIWDSAGKFQAHLNGHRGNVYQHLYFPEQKNIVTRSSDGSLKRWSLAGKWLQDLSESSYFQTMASPSDASHLVAADARGELRLWEQQKLTDVPSQWKASDTPIDRVGFFHPNNQILASKNILGELRLWDQKGQALSSSLTLDQVSDFLMLPKEDKILAWRKNGECLLLNEKAKLIDRWSLSGTNITAINYHASTQSFLATSQSDGQVLIQWFDLSGVSILRWEFSSDANPWPASFSKDGQWIIIPNSEAGAIGIYPLPDNILAELSLKEAGLITDEILSDYQIQWWDRE